jgi:hypothetical protein
LGRAAVVLALGLDIFGCAFGNEGGMAAYAEGFGIGAESVPGGLLLSFEDIPHDMDWMLITVVDITDDRHRFTAAFTEIGSLSLDQIRVSGSILFPFAVEGRRYTIGAAIGIGNTAGSLLAYNEVLAIYEGISVVNDITLDLNPDATEARLSEVPRLSFQVPFSSPRYYYIAHINAPRSSSSFSYFERNDEPFWQPDFAEIAAELRTNSKTALSGAMAISIQALCSVIAEDNTTWHINIARSREFTHRF